MLRLVVATIGLAASAAVGATGWILDRVFPAWFADAPGFLIGLGIAAFIVGVILTASMWWQMFCWAITLDANGITGLSAITWFSGHLGWDEIERVVVLKRGGQPAMLWIYRRAGFPTKSQLWLGWHIDSEEIVELIRERLSILGASIAETDLSPRVVRTASVLLAVFLAIWGWSAFFGLAGFHRPAPAEGTITPLTMTQMLALILGPLAGALAAGLSFVFGFVRGDVREGVSFALVIACLATLMGMTPLITLLGKGHFEATLYSPVPSLLAGGLLFARSVIPGKSEAHFLLLGVAVVGTLVYVGFALSSVLRWAAAAGVDPVLVGSLVASLPVIPLVVGALVRRAVWPRPTRIES